MGMVMIKCPITGKEVPTGFTMDKQSFANSHMSNNTFAPCPACGRSHTWNKPDAWVQD